MDDLIKAADRLARAFPSKAVDEYLDRKAMALGGRRLRSRPPRVFRDFCRAQLEEVAENIGFPAEFLRDVDWVGPWVGLIDPEEADRSNDESD